MNYFFEGKPITADKRVMILAHHHSDGTTLPPFIRQAPCMGLEATPSLHSQHKDKFYSFSESMKHLVFHFESWQMTETNGLMNLAYCPLQIRWAKSKNLCFHSLFGFSFLFSFCFLFRCASSPWEDIGYILNWVWSHTIIFINKPLDFLISSIIIDWLFLLYSLQSPFRGCAF